MKYENGGVSGINIAYIGGGSRGWAWKLMCDLAAEESLSGRIKLYDIDREAARNNELIGNRLSSRPEAKGKWVYETSDTLKRALTGADFAIISILPGTFREMQSDVHLPEKYGIYQSVGDTTGPGGIIRALRTIPLFMDIAEEVKKTAPDAWVINYTNPMSVCVRALYRVFPGIKAFGCCHEVFGTLELLMDMLEDMRGARPASRDEISVNILGINHFTWFDRASCKTTDLMKVFGEFTDKYFEEGFERGGKGNWRADYFSSAGRVKFDLFRQYGLIGAAGDRHLAEFMPRQYLRDPGTAEKYKFRLTPVSWRISDMEERLQKGKRLASGQEDLDVRPSGEEGVKQLKALLGLGDLVTNVNLPNCGQIKGLPEGPAVETNAFLSRDSIRPVYAGSMPLPVQNLVIRHLLNQETTVDAVLSTDKDMAFNAFLNDPMVFIGREDARKLFNEMLKNTEAHLPDWLH